MGQRMEDLKAHHGPAVLNGGLNAPSVGHPQQGGCADSVHRQDSIEVKKNFQRRP